MRNLLILFSCFSFINISNAQFGISARMNKNSVKDWNNIYQSYANDDHDLFGSGYEIGVNYWFRLKNYRIEFLPEVTYAKSKTSNLSTLVDAESHNLTRYNFNMNVQIYPLDFEGDCDCPTWSKDGNLVKKGFYWLLSPGISKNSISTTFSEANGRPDDAYDMMTFRMGAGLGLDIGVGDLLTISPFAIYNINFGSAWLTQETTYNANIEVAENDSSFNQLQIGIRMIFRPDYKN